MSSLNIPVVSMLTKKPSYPRCLELVKAHSKSEKRAEYDVLCREYEEEASKAYIEFMLDLVRNQVEWLLSKSDKKQCRFTLDSKKLMGGVFWHIVHYYGIPAPKIPGGSPIWINRETITAFEGLFDSICQKVLDEYGLYLYDISDKRKSFAIYLCLSKEEIFGPYLWHGYNSSGEK
jgi:hypothetical protein